MIAGVRVVSLALVFGIFSAHAFAQSVPVNPMAPGPGLKRAANMPDGAPAFEVLDAKGAVVRSIECINSGWYEIDIFAARVMASRELMATVIAKNGRIEMEHLGPAVFDCVTAGPIVPFAGARK